VSHYTAQRFLAGAEAIGGARLADTIAESIVLRYPGLPPAAYAQPDDADLREFRHKNGLRQDSILISTLGRLEEEKGLDTLLAIADIAAATRPELEFAIAGTGSLGDRLVEQAQQVPNLTVLRNISSHDAQCLRATTEVGIFPTKVIPGFIETFCVAALEYEALGVPILASAIGGVPEATPDDRFLVAPDTSAAEWLARIEEVLANRAERSAVAAAYAGKFTSTRSAQRLIDLAILAAGRLKRDSPLKLDPLDEYLTTWPARLPLVTQAETGAPEPV
jgi:glycosyltransferase involved in cell wall biosynthesis